MEKGKMLSRKLVKRTTSLNQREPSSCGQLVISKVILSLHSYQDQLHMQSLLQTLSFSY